MQRFWLYSLIAAAGGFAVIHLLPKFDRNLDREYVRSLIDSQASSFPLEGKTAVVTGSTSGLGQAIATELYGLGATVYVVGRTPSKLTKVSEDIVASSSASPGKVVVERLDTSDLNSVRDFSDKIQVNLGEDGKVDYLVNNAGIHHASTPSASGAASAQGFDMAFATNYLGHFLLTELMIPIMPDGGRVVQIASSMHMTSDGSMLRVPEGEGAMPLAAKAGVQDDGWHEEAAYGNNKLAQILHAKELQRRLDRKGSGVKIVSVCPNWVNTGILPDDIGGRLVASLAFNTAAGTIGALYSLFSSSIKGGEYVSNSRLIILEFLNPSKLQRLSKKVRHHIVLSLSMVVLMLQKPFYGPHMVDPTAEALDKNLARGLYQWSYQAVSEFLPAQE